MVLLATAAAALGLDQWSKFFLRSTFELGEVWYPGDWLSPYIQIVRVQNTGAAFSMGQGMSWIFIAAAVAAVIGILWYYPRFPQGDWLIRLSMALLLSGALGNLIDRLIFGHVTDFISISRFAVINIADIWINIGVGLFILWLVRMELLAKKPDSMPGGGDGEA